MTETLHYHTPEQNHISQNEFLTLPEEVENYTPGDEVTRKNFTSYLIRSFAVSHGNFSHQIAWLEWTDKVSGGDFITTFNNYFEVGGAHTLQEQERKNILDAYRRVRKHHKEGENTLTDEEVIHEFDNFLYQATQEEMQKFAKGLLPNNSESMPEKQLLHHLRSTKKL